MTRAPVIAMACWLQNSRHGEKIHAIATGREHRCSGWAGLHRRRSTACGLKKRVVNADAGSEFIAPSSQHPSHMPLHLECPGGAETVARQQPWSNREPPMSGVLGSPSSRSRRLIDSACTLMRRVPVQAQAVATNARWGRSAMISVSAGVMPSPPSSAVRRGPRSARRWCAPS